MSSQRIEPGVLVTFCHVETSVDLVFAEGLMSRDLTDRIMPGRGYFPHQGEVGLVIDGPEKDTGGRFTMWLVYVGGGNWWFADEHLIEKKLNQT
jgi:hypothetical protein